MISDDDFFSMFMIMIILWPNKFVVINYQSLLALLLAGFDGKRKKEKKPFSILLPPFIIVYYEFLIKTFYLFIYFCFVPCTICN